MNYTIRLETENDYHAVEALTREAFWNLYKPGCDEHYLVHTIRNSPDIIRDLNYVVEHEGQIIGYILYTVSQVSNEAGKTIRTATFGPVCVHPDFQRKGIGTALISHTKNIVIEKGFPAIIILGDPHNYCVHGFKTGRDYHVGNDEGKYPLGLLVLELEKGVFDGHRWTFKESDDYNIEFSPVDDYDRRFPPKEKRYQHSQTLYEMLIRAVLE